MRNSSLADPTFLRDTPDAAGWPTLWWDIALTALGATLMHGLAQRLVNHYPYGTVRELPLTAVDLAMPFWPCH